MTLIKKVKQYWEVDDWIYWSDKGWVRLEKIAPDDVISPVDPTRFAAIVPWELYKALANTALRSLETRSAWELFGRRDRVDEEVLKHLDSAVDELMRIRDEVKKRANPEEESDGTPRTVE